MANVATIVTIAQDGMVIIKVGPRKTMTRTDVRQRFFTRLPLHLWVKVSIPRRVTFITARLAFLPMLQRTTVRTRIVMTLTIFARIFMIRTNDRHSQGTRFAAIYPTTICPLMVTLRNGRTTHV